mgnify:CR=1 FL=1
MLDLPETIPLNNKANKLLVFLHGVGSDGYDLISLVPFIQNDLPNYHFISPHGVEPFDMAPFGRQWFSLQDRTPSLILKLVEQNAPKLAEIISKKQRELGLSNKDTILFGFSQGTMMASYLTLAQKDKPYAALIGFSGRLIAPVTGQVNTKTPICIIHGVSDDVVPCAESENFAKYCKELKIEHEMHLINNLTHSIDDKGLNYAVNFLNHLALA